MNRKQLLASLRIYGWENHVPNITDANALFLSELIQEKNVQNLLEIGTANGYSAIVFGTVLENTGWKMLSIDFSEKSHKMALKNIADAELSERVTLQFGNALDVIPQLNEIYDFVFIDGMKRRTKDFLQLVWDKVAPGGTIVVDDVIKFKDKMIGFYEWVEQEGMNYRVLDIDEDDGIMVIQK